MDSPAPLGPFDLAACLTRVVAPEASGLVIAVSGGPDSMALMASLAALRHRTSLPPLTVGTVDHALRAGSAGDAALVEATAARLGLPCRRLVWTGDKPRHAIQEKARDARYALLLALCADVGADHLLTAHTLEDQAETVLFRLIRGSGPSGLAGMAEVARRGGVRLARPLLGIEKSRLIATCRAHAVPFRTDPANTDPRFARARLRALAPTLAREGLHAGTLARLARRCARADAALDHATATLLTACRLTHDRVRLDADRLAGAPQEIVIRLLGCVIMEAGGKTPRLDALERLADRLTDAVRSGRRAAITLGGTRLSLSEGVLSVVPEGPRRRGLHAATAFASPPHATMSSVVAATTGAFPWQG